MSDHCGMLCIKSLKSAFFDLLFAFWDHSFSIFTKFSKNLTFLSPDTHTSWKVSFLEHFTNLLNEWSLSQFLLVKYMKLLKKKFWFIEYFTCRSKISYSAIYQNKGIYAISFGTNCWGFILLHEHTEVT